MLPQNEQESVRRKYYAEAIYYMDKAKETLQKAGMDDYHYTRPRYVRKACKTAYNGVLIALEAYLLLKSEKQETKGRQSIEYYCKQVGKIDENLLLRVDSAYEVLQQAGYYDGSLDSQLIQIGFDRAYEIINQIKPTETN